METTTREIEIPGEVQLKETEQADDDGKFDWNKHRMFVPHNLVFGILEHCDHEYSSDPRMIIFSNPVANDRAAGIAAHFEAHRGIIEEWIRGQPKDDGRRYNLVLIPFMNCRERGYTMFYGKKEITFAENRNSDDIIVYRFSWTQMQVSKKTTDKAAHAKWVKQFQGNLCFNVPNMVDQTYRAFGVLLHEIGCDDFYDDHWNIDADDDE